MTDGTYLAWDSGTGHVDRWRIEYRQLNQPWKLLQDGWIWPYYGYLSYASLVPGAHYEWRVRAENAGGVSDFRSETFMITPDPPGESAPLSESPTARQARLSWGEARPVVYEQDYEGTSSAWERSAPNQGRTTEAAHSGSTSWKIESFSGCDPACYYMASAWKLATDLDLNRPIRFSAWVKAPVGHGDLHIQLKYEAGGVWHYPGTADYQDTGAWEQLEVMLDPGAIPDLERIEAIVRHVGTTGAPAYIDDLQLVTDGPVATTYDVEVATDSTFANGLESRSGIAAPTAGDRTLTVEGLSRATAYHWRVRGTNPGGNWHVDDGCVYDDGPHRPALLPEGSPRLDPGGGGPGRPRDRDRTATLVTAKVVEARDDYPFSSACGSVNLPVVDLTSACPGEV